MTAETIERGANKNELEYRQWGVPIVEGTVCLSPDDYGLKGAMALVTAESSTGASALAFRGICERRGDPGSGETDFVDHSKLFTIIDNQPVEIVIEGGEREFSDLIERLPQGEYEALGREDPTLVWEGDVLHVFYTIAVMDRNECFFFTVGHAAGPDIEHLQAQPLPLSSLGGKEPCFTPDARGGLLEQADDGYSTIASFRARTGAGGEFSDLSINLLPQYTREYFEGSYRYDHIPDDVQWNWMKEHVSPCTILPTEYLDIDPDGTLDSKVSVVVLSARSASTKSKDGKDLHGPFRVGMGLMISDTESDNFGEFVWVSPLPMFEDPNARKITFACDCQINDDGSLTIFAHLDDHRVCEYTFTKQEVAALLPQLGDVRRFMTQR